MTLEETLERIKLRLQDQQAKVSGTEIQIRAELDALWACVEVLAQALGGREEIVVPDYFGDSKRRVPRGPFKWLRPSR